MSSSRRSLNETESSIPTRLEISKLLQNPLKEQSDRHDDVITGQNTVLKVVSKSWRDKKRLYPPFRGRRKDVFAQKDQQGKKIVGKSVREPNKFRLSVCIQKKQFPIVCTNVLDFGGSNLLYSSSGCAGDNETPPICALHDVSSIGPIFNLDNESCNVTRVPDRANDVCRDTVYTHDNKSEDVSVPGVKPESQFYMTANAESIDYMVCGSKEDATITAFEDEASRGDVGEEDYFDIHEGEYESSGSTSEHKSTLEKASESELFQDPFVSHRLTIPYKEMPPSRYCAGGSLNNSTKIKLLAKRPQSPVRDIPEGRFDVRAGITEVTRRAELHNAKYALRKSEEWMAKMITSDSMALPTSGTSAELLMTFLKVLLDDVRLSLTVGESENDFSLTLATVWAITEFVMTGAGLEVTQSIAITNLATVPKLKHSLSHNLTLLKATSFQRTSDINYPPRGSDNHSLHRALPWFYLCAAHAEGLPKSYATVQTYIDEVTPDNDPKRPRAPYFPDLSCAHFKEMPSSKPVLLKNKAEELEPEDHTD